MPLSKTSKIAIVAASAPPYGAGGVASAHYNLYRALERRGYNVRLFTFFDNDVPRSVEGNIVRSGAPQWLVSLIYFLARLPFRIFQPQKTAYQSAVVWRSMLGSAKMARAINAFTPRIVILSDHGAPGLFIRKNAEQQFFLVSHHNPARFLKQPLLGDFSREDAMLALYFENLVLRKVDHVICPSSYMSEQFQATYTFSGPVSVVPNLLDEDLIDNIQPAGLQKIIGLPGSAKVIYLPSAGTAIKGAPFLRSIIEGLANRPDIGFYIPGYLENAIIGQIDPTWLARIHLPGQLTYEEHIANVKDCTFGISPAILENFSMALLEATYCGVPMVAFDIGGNKDIIHDGQDGFLVPPFDVGALLEKAKSIIEMPDMDAFKRQTRNFAQEMFGTQKTFDKYLALLQAE